VTSIFAKYMALILTLAFRNDGSKAFPSPYHFATPEESEALARRAARFRKPSTTSSVAQPMGVGGWFADEDDEGGPAFNMSADAGMVPDKVGRKKIKGKGGLGYSGEEVIEVDPVSARSTSVTGRANGCQNVIDWDSHTIRGTNNKLEKSYLRLTTVSGMRTCMRR